MSKHGQGLAKVAVRQACAESLGLGEQSEEGLVYREGARNTGS